MFIATKKVKLIWSDKIIDKDVATPKLVHFFA